MLRERIKGNLPFPPDEASLIIYNFLVDETNGNKHEGWIHDLGTDEFKRRIKKEVLGWLEGQTNGEPNVVEGTNIRWKIEDETMFVFWLEEE